MSDSKNADDLFTSPLNKYTDYELETELSRRKYLREKERLAKQKMVDVVCRFCGGAGRYEGCDLWAGYTSIVCSQCNGSGHYKATLRS